MSFAYIAAGGLVVTGIGIYQGMQESDRAARLGREATAVQQESLDFSKQQYADWKDTYGGIEENLSNFYENLTPDYIEAQGLQASQLEYQNTRREMDKFFASAGIEAGVQSDALAKLGMQSARDKAQIRADAPIKAAEAKSSFLSIGLGQKPGIAAGVTRGYEGKSTSLLSQADQASASADQAFGTAASAAGAGTEAYIKSQMSSTAAGGKPVIEGSVTPTRPGQDFFEDYDAGEYRGAT